MSVVVWLGVAISFLVAIGLAGWVWIAIANESDDLLSFVGFEGMHLED